MHIQTYAHDARGFIKTIQENINHCMFNMYDKTELTNKKKKSNFF